MLGHLIESRPRRGGWRRGSRSVAVSVGAHALAFAAWFGWAQANPTAFEEQPEVEYIDLPQLEEPTPEPEPEPEPEPKAPEFVPPEPEVEPEQAKGFQELQPPEEVSGIPPEAADVDSVRVEDFSGRGIAGGVADGTLLDAPVADSASELEPARPVTVDLADVTEAPVLRNRDRLGRVLQRHYPGFLRDSRTNGAVRVEFVVDSTGRIVDGSIDVKETTHPLFESATKAAVQDFRFTPGRMAWQGDMVRVPVRVTMTLSWNVR